jgi:FeS assembly SUF system protein
MSERESNENSGFRVEEASAAPKPPRARVSDAELPGGGDHAEGAERRRDYLDGFLAENPGAPGGDLRESVIAALKDIFDPEIPVNIYELGLIYDVDVSGDGAVVVTMTLTTPHCPVAESMPGEVELRIASLPGVRDCEVNLVWEPPWGMEMMSDEAKLELGML